MRVPASAVLALCSAAATAAQWVDIASPGAPMLQIDAASVVREGDVARAWDKAVYPRDQVLGSGDTAYRSVRTLTGYHCVLRTSLPLARVFFTEDGRELLRSNVEGVEFSQPVVPDSPRARMLELACAKQARGEPRPAAAGAAGNAAPRPPQPGADAKPEANPKEGQAAKPAPDKTEVPTAAPKAERDGKSTSGEGKSTSGDGKSASGEGKPAAPGEAKPAKAESPAASPKTGKPESKTGKAAEAPPAADKPAPRAPGTKVRWSYEGKQDGPAVWHKLDPEFQLCGEGKRQSPIDIKDSVRLQIEGLKFDYRPFTLRIVDNGHTVQVTVPPGSAMTLGTRSYELLQFHFHKPSEERIAGKSYDMAAHFVHKSKDGRLAVLAVLFATGPDNAVIQSLWNHLPLEPGRDEEIPGVRVDLNALLPKNRGYFTYMGSLTTPPCTEGVQWVVLKTPVMISRGQVSVFGKLHGMNARPLQPAHGRLIKETL